jgi:hypothetical protein
VQVKMASEESASQAQVRHSQWRARRAARDRLVGVALADRLWSLQAHRPPEGTSRSSSRARPMSSAAALGCGDCWCCCLRTRAGWLAKIMVANSSGA